MSGFPQIEAFHFIRPAALLLVPAAALLWWLVRRRATATRPIPAGIAPHLAEALTVGAGKRRRMLPIDLVAVAAILMALGAAGPTWSRVPNPLVADTAPLVIALQLSDSMLALDVPPSRLARAQQKIRDLLANRAGARTALVAYGGTAHLVAPLAQDPDILIPFVEGLSPEIMPQKGRNATAAAAIARETLGDKQTPGAVLFVLDEIDRADHAALEQLSSEHGLGVFILSVGAAADVRAGMRSGTGAPVVAVTPDGADIGELERRITASWQAALDREDRQQWEDRSWLLAWPAALLTMLWFRRGWTMRWAVVLAVTVALPSPEARADGVTDWFFTPDQQGWRLYRDKRFAEAADAFADPMWRGIALYRSGQYPASAELFARLDTADAAFARGMAMIRSRDYRGAIAAFETAVELDPEHAPAARNAEVARAVLAYVEDAREASDTGEEKGIGADDVVFDNTAARGAETEAPPEASMKPETAAQWLRTVDTRMADFLRARFALEAAREGQR